MISNNKKADVNINPVSNRNFGLDLVRTIAIASVIAAHFSTGLRDFGFWGVEIFFALSGFLIGQILWRSYSKSLNWNLNKIFNFWSRRWWRTLPNYYLFLIIFLFFQYYVNEKLPTYQRFSFFLWFGQDLLVRKEDFFVVSWSLCVEEWFYLLFPIVLYFASRIKLAKNKIFILSILFFSVACLSLRFYLIYFRHIDSVRGVTLARLDSISYGVLAAFIVSSVTTTNRITYILALAGGLLLFISYLLSFNFSMIASSFIYLSIPLGFALLLPAICKLPMPSSTYRYFKKGVESISLWSYSIYLCHIPVLFTVYKVLDDYRNNTMINLLSKILALVITIIISAFLFKYFELPLTKKRKPE